jgi:hypothetical protein
MGSSGLIDEPCDCTVIIDYDSQYHTTHISSYTPLASSTVPESLFYAYLSTCDLSSLPALQSQISAQFLNQFPTQSHSVSNPIAFEPTPIFTLSPTSYTNNPCSETVLDRVSAFINECPKRKYKPVAQKVRSIVAEVPKKFCVI